MRNTDRSFAFLLCMFVVLYPYFIIPMDPSYYYANSKAYYLIGFTFALWTLRWFTSKQQFDSITRMKPTEWLLVLWLMLVGLSTYQAASYSLVGHQSEHQGLLVHLAYFILFLATARWMPRNFQPTLVRWIVLGSLLPALYGIAQHIGIRILPQDKLPETHLPRYRFEQRSWSLFDNPDYFGAYLVIVLLLALTCYLSAGKRSEAAIYATVSGVLGTALILTSTRSAWVGATVGVVMLLFSAGRVYKHKRMWQRVAFVGGAGCLLFAALNMAADNDYVSRAATIPADMKKIFTEADNGSAGASRWYIWQTTLPFIKEYFWLGTGPNSFRQLFHPGIAEDFTQYVRQPVYDANNEYLQIALTMGVPALGIYLTFLAAILRSGYRAARRAVAEQQLFLYGLLAAAMGYCIQALFNISVVSVAPYFWIVLGCIAAGSRRARRRSN